MVMAVLIIFTVILQTVINLRMLSIGGQSAVQRDYPSLQWGRLNVSETKSDCSAYAKYVQGGPKKWTCLMLNFKGNDDLCKLSKNI